MYVAGVITSVTPARGPATGGTTVTLQGTDLNGGNDVTLVLLAGVPAIVVQQNATRVVVVSGAATASATGFVGDVTIVSASGGPVVGGNLFTYTSSTLFCLFAGYVC